MALSGKAVMVLSLDVAPEAFAAHDVWHSHEHLQERLGIPGFRRGSRWTAVAAQPHYFVLYEVDELATLSSPPYLERLNHPTPATAGIMTRYRGMRRGFCRVTASYGLGLGRLGLVLYFSPPEAEAGRLRSWLSAQLASVPSRSGLSGAHLFEAAARPEMTVEQRIRGRDGEIDWVVLVNAYDTERLREFAGACLSCEQFLQYGVTGFSTGIYQLDHVVTEQDVSQI